MGMIPLTEPLAPLHDDHVRPPGIQIVDLARLDGHHLRRPEGIAIGKEAVLAEQVGDNAALEPIHVEQRMFDRNRRAAEQPCLELMAGRSEEHTSELQSLMRISYAVFCLKKKKI